MRKEVSIMLSQGFEEMEYICPLDLWRRAGIEVSTIKIETGPEDQENLSVTGAHGVQLTADAHWRHWISQKSRADLVFLPGGLPGSSNLAAHKEFTAYLSGFAGRLFEEDCYLAAICAAPALVLGKATGILRDHGYTCYPGMEKEVPGDLNAQKKEEAVVLDRRILTGSGPGAAHLLAFQAIELLLDTETAITVLAGARFPSFF